MQPVCFKPEQNLCLGRKAEKEKRKAEEERRKAEEDAKKPKEVKDMETEKFYVGITYDDFLKKAELNGWDLKKEGKFLKNGHLNSSCH